MIAASKDDDDRKELVSGVNAESHSQSPQEPQPEQEKSGRGDLFTPDAKGMGLLNSALRRGFRLSRKLKHRAVEAADECLSSPDDETKLGAVRAVIQMERVNVASDKQPANHNHLHLHAPQQVQVIYVDDWYGSKAASLAATNGASASGPNVG